jgi:hypothetical protein
MTCGFCGKEELFFLNVFLRYRVQQSRITAGDYRYVVLSNFFKILLVTVATDSQYPTQLLFPKPKPYLRKWALHSRQECDGYLEVVPDADWVAEFHYKSYWSWPFFYLRSRDLSTEAWC